MAAAAAEQHNIDGESVIVVPVDGDGPRLLRQARAALPDHYPVLILFDIDDALDRLSFEADGVERTAADVLALAASGDIDALVDEFSAGWDPVDLGTGDEGYHLVVVAAAQRWHHRYGAEPTVLSLATGFTVSRPPVTRVDAERLAMEHLFIAGLSARTTPRAYAKALLELDHWCLYDRP